MRCALWFLTALPLLAADPWPLEKLFTRPYVWGTSPSAMAWSRTGHRLGFLWNAQGNRFLDLYVYAAGADRLVRVTNLEPMKDEFWVTAEQKDDRRKYYVMPEGGLNAFALADDGKTAAFTYKGDVFTAATDGAHPAFRLTRTRAPESHAAFVPGTNKLSYVRDGQVFTRDLTNGQEWQVTDIQPPRDLEGYVWSRDGQRLCYWTERAGGRKLPLPNYSGRLVTAAPFSRDVAGDDPPETAFAVVPAAGGKPVEIDLGPIGGKGFFSDPKWSPDSARIAIQMDAPLSVRQTVIAADAATGKPKVLVDEKDEAWVFGSEFGWSPDSRWLWFTSERDGYAHLYKVSVGGGEAIQLTKGQFEVRAERFTHEAQWAGEWIYFSSTENGPSERHLYRIRPDGTGKRQMSSGAGIHDGLVTEDGAITAWMHATLEEPLDLWVGERRVTTSPRAEFAGLPWPKTEFVAFPSRHDGKTVHAKLLLPPGYEDAPPGKRWPCVFFVHGAGYATSVLKQWGSYHDLRFVYNTYLANKGYVVLDLDYRGSSGYGRDWRTGVYLHMGGADLGDVLGAADFLKKRGTVDMARLGIWGVSYGGFMTNMAMFLSPDTFRAGSSWAAVNDWENYNAWYTGQRLSTPARRPEAYRRSSPINFSRDLKNHLLIVHGMVDNNVLFQDAVQLTEKLVHEGKDFSHSYYPQESHGFVRDETWIDALRRTTEWLDRYLAP
ncbi:MAG: prolyl oligopeptidase family serine peptidase [Bryobacteraceae bacterium]